MASMIDDHVYRVALYEEQNFIYVSAKDSVDLAQYLAQSFNIKDICSISRLGPDGALITVPIVSKLHAYTSEKKQSNEESPGPIAFIDGKPWSVRLPRGGSRKGVPSEWDTIMKKLGDANDLLHWRSMYSLCQDSVENSLGGHTCRGYDSEHSWSCLPASAQNEFTGFRPVLIPLNPTTLKPDPKQISHIPDRSVVRMGCLYMNEHPVDVPTNPTYDGDIPDYMHGASLRIGQPLFKGLSRHTLHFIKCGDILICDRNLLKNIPWVSLEKQGLVYGREGKKPSLADQMAGAAVRQGMNPSSRESQRQKSDR